MTKMSGQFLEQRINIKFCVELRNFCKELSLEMKHCAFNIIPKAND